MQTIQNTLLKVIFTLTIALVSGGLVHAGAGVEHDGSVADKTSDEQAYAKAISTWQSVLATYVDDEGRTDFLAIEQQPEQLKAVVDVIAEISPASHPQLFPTHEQVIAYHINTYNALAMYGVIERGIPENFSSFFKRASFFKFRSVIIGGKKTNLYDYENKVIRPLDEPRTHFALNCMVRDCPRLPQQAFLPDLLEEQLDAAAKEFFSKPKYIRVDDEKREVHLSSILKFYTKDFVKSGKKRDLPQYVNRYVSTPIPNDYKVHYIPYDWTINQQPKS